LIAIAIIVIGLVLMASATRRNKMPGGEPIATNPPPASEVQPEHRPGAERAAEATFGQVKAIGFEESNRAATAVEEIAAIYRRVVEKVEAAQNQR